MQIKNQQPPNYRDILDVFPTVPTLKPCFCYGDTIYNPFEIEILPDLEFHESIHSKQQSDSPEIWWYTYLHNKTFRLEQELEAYGGQYAFILKHIPNNALRKWKLEHMARSLSSDLYGNIITYGEAESRIKKYAKTNT